MKECTKCGGYMPDSCFARISAYGNRKARLASWCNQCISVHRKTPVRELTTAQLRQELRYDPATGVFTRLANQWRPADLVGTVAGATNNNGYRTVSVGRKRYYAHRLAWLYMTGEWPGLIDHINGDKADNRWENLRAVTIQMNTQNVRRAQANNSSGYLGVHYCKTTGRYRAMLRVGKKYRHLGRFDTPEEAYAAYIAAKRESHEGCTI